MKGIKKMSIFIVVFIILIILFFWEIGLTIAGDIPKTSFIFQNSESESSETPQEKKK